MGDMAGLIKKIKEVVPADQNNLANPMLKENFTLRDMYEQFQTILKMGPLGKVMEMLPGMGQLLQQLPGAGADSTMKVKIYMTIMDSMTDDGNRLLRYHVFPLSSYSFRARRYEDLDS